MCRRHAGTAAAVTMASRDCRSLITVPIDARSMASGVEREDTAGARHPDHDYRPPSQSPGITTAGGAVARRDGKRTLRGREASGAPVSHGKADSTGRGRRVARYRALRKVFSKSMRRRLRLAAAPGRNGCAAQESDRPAAAGYFISSAVFGMTQWPDLCGIPQRWLTEGIVQCCFLSGASQRLLIGGIVQKPLSVPVSRASTRFACAPSAAIAAAGRTNGAASRQPIRAISGLFFFILVPSSCWSSRAESSWRTWNYL